MKNNFKNTFIILIFIGLFLSCFQFTINQLSKITKVVGIEQSCEDIDSNEDDTETKKIEIEDDFFLSEFSYTFNQRCNSKVILFCKQQKQNQPPVIAINTPPPKV